MPEGAKKGDTVRVHYTGRLEDGSVFDSSEGGEPFEFTLGTGDAIAGFDAAVTGLSVGESRRVEIEPEDAYGPQRDSLVAQLARASAQFPSEPQVGDNFMMQLSDDHQMEVTVTAIDDTYITIDGNHPLAGQKLIFDIELVEIKK